MLLTAEGVGTAAIMRETGKSGTCVLGAGRSGSSRGASRGLLRDKATRPRPSHIPPLGPAIAKRVVALTMDEPPLGSFSFQTSMTSMGGTWKPAPPRKSDPAARLSPQSSRKFGLGSGRQRAQPLLSKREKNSTGHYAGDAQARQAEQRHQHEIE